MNDERPRRSGLLWRETRFSIGIAIAMLVFAAAAPFARHQGWLLAAELAKRIPMALMGLLIASVGNEFPKQLPLPRCAIGNPAVDLAFRRFAGWTWVLTGVALAVASLALPMKESAVATLLIVPTGTLVILVRWLSLNRARPAA